MLTSLLSADSSVLAYATHREAVWETTEDLTANRVFNPYPS